MNTLRALAWKELRILARDRHGLAVLFLMPAVFILIMSLALRDALDPAGHAGISYLWLDDSGGYFALTLSDRLSERAALTRQRVADLDELQRKLRDGEISFAVRVPADFESRVRAAAQGPGAALVQVYLSPSAPPQTRLLFLAQLRAALTAVQAEYLLEDLMGVPHEDAQRVRRQIDPEAVALDEIYLGRAPGAVEAPNAVQQSVPAWLVFAMFFVVLPIAVSVLAEREQGNLQRLSLLNVSPLQLLAGKFPAYYGVNLVQLVLMLAVGVVLVPRLGGDRLALGSSLFGLWLIASALSFAAIGFALLIATVAKSAVQATTLGGIANLIFGAVGGVMVPKSVMPPVMQEAAVLSPMSWALEGCWDILLRGGGAVDVLPEAAALLAFGAASLAAAAVLFPKGEG
jgi:ABC-2 type transport system permease protein